MPLRLRNADLAVCRAGASTVAELTCFGVAAIFVPLAISKDNDQGENAQAVVNAGGAWVLREKDLIPQKLADLLVKVMQNPAILTEMSQAMRTLAKPLAAEDLANWVESFL
jgi:UDP-N-acetylglucosamine--N-acetylmuramyl-(pentapeptide) pyrophosphoryl-undecaprenol N-acetylglucosamine transferase